MDSALARLCDQYFRSWMAADPFAATEFGVAGYDSEVPDPSREADAATSIGVQVRVLALVPRAPLTDARRARDYLERCRKLGGYLDGVLARHLEAKEEGRFPTARGVAQAVVQLDAYLASD